MNVKLQLREQLQATVYELFPIAAERQLLIEVAYPPDDKFGDYTTNVAMRLAPLIHRSPQEIADLIKQKMPRIPALRDIEIIQPGFINFYLDEKWLVRRVAIIIKQKKRFGTADIGKNRRVLVEFVSANPTGPLHLGNGRGAFMGDALANVLQLAGYGVQREYYVNDMGKQVGVLAESVLRRYWQQQGIRIEYPEYCYQGEYVKEMARKLFLPNYKINNIQKLEQIRDKIKSRILRKMISHIKKFLKRDLGIVFDQWFSEKSLYESGQVDAMLRFLKERSLLYKSDGAIWLKTKQFGDEKNRVLIKSNEEPVYFLSDIAYHWNKLVKRGFDRAIDILGADHHGYIGRMQAAVQLFGQPGQLDILIVQLVRLINHGQEIRMSKRSGNFVTLEELVREVGADATRFFFLMHDANTHMDFDMDLAKKRSKDNPVYYVQYAHARICSIIRKLKQLKGTKLVKPRGQALQPSEARLLKKLIQWPELVVDVAGSYQVHRLPPYAMELATVFHEFYTQCQVIDGREVNERRMRFLRATQIVLQNVLATIGVTAPERM